MTESGSGQHDDRDPRSGDGGGSGDDHTPSASWETSRGSSWESTTPYESPWAAPGSSGTAASGSSAVDRPGEDGPWPTYPDPAPSSYQQPQPNPSGYQQTGYGQPAAYGVNPPPDQTGYPPQPVYGQEPPYGVNPYQQPAYGGYAMPNHPQATTAMVLGIVGLVALPTTCVGGLVGIGGIVLGRRARQEIDASPSQWGGRGTATAGFVMGIISVVGFALFLGLVIILAATGSFDS